MLHHIYLARLMFHSWLHMDDLSVICIYPPCAQLAVASSREVIFVTEPHHPLENIDEVSGTSIYENFTMIVSFLPTAHHFTISQTIA